MDISRNTEIFEDGFGLERPYFSFCKAKDNPYFNDIVLNLSTSHLIQKIIIEYIGADGLDIDLFLYDITGAKMVNLAHEIIFPGIYSYGINGADLSSGSFFAVVVSSAGTSVLPISKLKNSV